MSQHLKKELYNNHLKLTKWGVQSYLAGVDEMKIGFVTRKNMKNNTAHKLVGFFDTNPNDILSITNFNKFIAWGIFKHIIDIIRIQPDGTFILLKTLTSAKPLVKLLKLPANSNLQQEEEEF
jgi:translation initiation factor 3 subunit D